tara:strand:- start:42 stop:809 length:768 start_codon:yes stop_codon:yes gene_type:complete
MMINLKTNKMSDLNNGGLVYETSNNNDVYVEIKPDALLVRRIKGEHADELIEKFNDNKPVDHGFRVRKLEMGENMGNLVVEQLFNKIPTVQLKKVYEKESFGSRRMVLVFNDHNDGPNINVTCQLVNEKGSVNSFASSFIDKVPNFKIGTPCTFSLWSFYNKDTDKTKKGVNIDQNGVKIKSPYYDLELKKRIGDKPIATKKIKLGKEVWDFSEVSEFQLQIFNDFSVKLDEYWGNEKPLATTKTKEVQVADMPF